MQVLIIYVLTEINQTIFCQALLFALLCLNTINYIYASASVNKTFAFIPITVFAIFSYIIS